MKKLLLLLITFTAISFTACKKDKEATLDGTWITTKMVQRQYQNDILKGEMTMYTTTDDEKMAIAFQGNQWIQYSLSSQEIPSFSEEQTFVYANGKISLTGSSELPPDVEVKSLTERTLVLKMGFPMNNDDENVRQEQEITLEKR